MGGLLKYYDGYDNQPITWIDDPVSVRDVQSAQVFNNAAGFTRPCQIEIKHSLVTRPLDRWQSPLDGSAWKPCIAILKTPFFKMITLHNQAKLPRNLLLVINTVVKRYLGIK